MYFIRMGEHANEESFHRQLGVILGDKTKIEEKTKHVLDNQDFFIGILLCPLIRTVYVYVPGSPVARDEGTGR